MITEWLSLLVSDQKTSLAGGKQRKYKKNRQSDRWMDGLEESSNFTNQVKKWKGGWMCVLRALVLGPASVDKACLVNWTCCSDMEPFFCIPVQRFR